MAPESTKHEGDKQKSLDQEVRDLISALTNRLGGPSSTDDEDQGVKIITLAGSNVGATMRGGGDMNDKAASPQPEQDDPASSYLVNSNFQAINNSIMLGGSYKTNDPGVHLDITQEDYVNDIHKKGRKGKRGSSYKSDHHVDTTDGDETS